MWGSVGRGRRRITLPPDAGYFIPPNREATKSVFEGTNHGVGVFRDNRQKHLRRLFVTVGALLPIPPPFSASYLQPASATA